MPEKKLRYAIVLLSGALITLLALILIPEKVTVLPESQSSDSVREAPSRETGVTDTASPAGSGTALPSSVTPAPAASGTALPSSVTTAGTSSAGTSIAAASSEKETSAAEAGTAPPSPSETSSEERQPDFSRVAFIGDSRTLFMGSGDIYTCYSDLVPNSSIFATYGGTLTASSAFSDAENAGRAGRELAVFWFGVNDSQLDPERDNASVFIDHYLAVIDAFRTENPAAEIVLLSVIGTSVTEWGYYEGQEENIRKYNEALQELALGQGFRYIDLAFMNTSEADFLPDGIHFTEEWYGRFVPAVAALLEI